MSEEFHIWTIQLGQWRAAAESGIEMIDVTAKSGIKEFAPPFQEVMNYKEGRLSQLQYTDMYMRRMRDSRAQSKAEWKKLIKHKRMAIACYCGAGQYCHRHLFVVNLKQYLEELGHKVNIRGELRKALPSLEPKPIPEGGSDVYPFYTKEHPFSNWNPRGFTVKNVYFHHGECFMMYCKAKLMGDHATAELILKEKDPGECKRLGKLVTPYDDALWRERAPNIMCHGWLQKAKEHPDIAMLLLSTGNKILVEASKRDMIWGAGVDEDDPRIYFPDQWPGTNDHGKVLMRTRMKLQEDVIF